MKRPALTLKDLGEDEIVRRLTRQLPLSGRTLVGAGDDCAVLGNGPAHQLFKTDCVTEHIHFLPETPPQKIGWKALCRCISDIAAMGGQPTEAVITIAAPKSTPWARLSGIYAGLRRASQRYGVGLVGGETSSLPEGAPLFISVAMLGSVEPRRLVLRSGGRPGHAVMVTGVLGGSIHGWHLNFLPRLQEARWLTQHFKPSAMMDLSDGPAQDLPRLATASQCGFELYPTLLPRRRGATTEQALTDGEDYELLFTLPGKKRPALESAWKRQFPKLKLTMIGELNDGESEEMSGWDHFAS